MSKTETARQTLTGIIRSRMASYQARQLAGVTQKTFAEELTNEGHPISYADFRTLYSRARKQLSASITVAEPAPKPIRKEPPNHAINKPEPTQKEDENIPPIAAHRPTDLDAIHDQEVDLRSLAKLAKRKKQ